MAGRGRSLKGAEGYFTDPLAASSATSRAGAAIKVCEEPAQPSGPISRQRVTSWTALAMERLRRDRDLGETCVGLPPTEPRA